MRITTAPVSLGQAVDEASVEPEALATHIEHLRGNDVAWQRRLELLDAAQKSIVVTTYYVEADAYGEQFMRKLIDKAKSGVEISLTLDFPAHNSMLRRQPKEARDRMYAMMEELNKAGGSVRYIGTPTEQLQHPGSGMHFKSMVFDGTQAILGGRNVGESYFNEWSDYDLHVQGPIVSTIARQQLALLDEAKHGYRESPVTRAVFALHKERLTEITEAAAKAIDADVTEKRRRGEDIGHPLRLMLGDPAHVKGPNPITKFLLHATDSVEKTFYASSNFVNPPRQLREALINASLRGAHVMLVTTSEAAATVTALPYWIARSHYQEMLDAGVEIYETPSFEHGKMYVVDNKMAAVGSYNLGKPADSGLVEGLLVSEDKGDVAKIKEAFLKKASESKRVTSGEITGFGRRLLGLVGKLYDP